MHNSTFYALEVSLANLKKQILAVSQYLSSGYIYQMLYISNDNYSTLNPLTITLGLLPRLSISFQWKSICFSSFGSSEK